MKIGKATVPHSAICTSNEERIVIRGADLCDELIGQMGFADYFFFLLTGRKPDATASTVLNATLVAIAEHGLVPSVQAARMTFAAAPDAMQGAVAAGVLGCGTVVLGSSETAGGCVYDGVPLDGVGVTLGHGGRVRIAGPTLFSHYESDPELTAASVDDGWFLTSDEGRFDDDGRLQIVGRIDDVVISGGVKIPLALVADRLRENLQVEQAEVFGVPDAEWGQKLVAVIVGTANDAELRDWISLVHPRSWAPREFVRAGSLPLLPNGKVDRQAIQAAL